MRQHSSVSQPLSPRSERQVVEMAQDEPVSRVEVGEPPFQTKIIRVLRERRVAEGAENARAVVDRLRPCVGSQKREPSTQSLFGTKLQRIIGTGTCRFDVLKSGKLRIGRDPARRRLVEVAPPRK